MAKKTVQKVGKGTVKKAVKKVDNKTAKKIAKKVAKKTVKRTAKKAVEKAAKGTAKKIFKKVAKNKVVISALAFALVFTGAFSVYASHLGGEIDALGEQLAAFQEQRETEISTLRDEMVAFEGETLASLDALDNELRGVTTEMEQSVINADRLYEQVSQGIVRISDGENVLGSGFAFDAEGHILTAQHVIEGQNQIYVISADGLTSPAIVTGSCEYSDVAVLKQRLPIPILTLADSTTVKAGDPVIVIGSPLGLMGTITSGIVSQTDQFAEVVYDTETRGVANIIQFDAAVNFGNSGSPLLNSKGEVIGMVIARIDPSLGEGVYYAISANKVERVALSLIEYGSFDYPWLGVEITDLTPEAASARNLETVNGVLVTGVIPATPAVVAGIRVNDVIVAINGIPVQDVADLVCYLGEYVSPSDEVTLALIRNGVRIELSLRVGKRVD